MAYDEQLADRVREVLGPRAPFTEIKMFGGLCFTVRGNMVVGVVDDELMARVGPDVHDQALARPGARPMDFTKKPMRGFLFVGGPGISTDRRLASWVDRCLAYTETLPPKKPRKPKPRKPMTRRSPTTSRASGSRRRSSTARRSG